MMIMMMMIIIIIIIITRFTDTFFQGICLLILSQT